MSTSTTHARAGTAIAEGYLLGDSTEADAGVFRRHCLGCAVCRRALREERELICAFRSAARMIAASELKNNR